MSKILRPDEMGKTVPTLPEIMPIFKQTRKIVQINMIL